MWYYYYFLTSRDPNSRKPLPRAHLFNIVTQCLYFATFTIFGLANGVVEPAVSAERVPVPLPIGGIQPPFASQ